MQRSVNSADAADVGQQKEGKRVNPATAPRQELQSGAPPREGVGVSATEHSFIH